MKYNDVCEFEYIDNYLALLACIISEITIERSLKVITGEGQRGGCKNGKRVHPSTQVVYVIDTLENKTYTFDYQKDAAKHLNVHTSTVSDYMARDRKYQNRYVFKRENKREI